MKGHPSKRKRKDLAVQPTVGHSWTWFCARKGLVVAGGCIIDMNSLFRWLASCIIRVFTLNVCFTVRVFLSNYIYNGVVLFHTCFGVVFYDSSNSFWWHLQ